VDEARARRAEASVARVRDRRRHKVTSVPGAGSPTVASGEAAREGRTVFPRRVAVPGPRDRVLKDGANSSKIGGDVLVGRLRGARIYTLTLEERATCPRACALWSTCYGNGMPHADRWEWGAETKAAILRELAEHCARGPVLLRLHVLGDFPAEEDVAWWRGRLQQFPDLSIFGFTAHAPRTPVGAAVAAVRDEFPGRFCVRHSGTCGRWGSFTVDFPTERKKIGDALVCPEQRDAMAGLAARGRHCGDCAACWESDVAVVFVEH